MKSLVKIGGVGVALAALAFQTTSPAFAANGVNFTNSSVDKVYGSGSDTTFALMNDLASAYTESDGCLLSAAGFPLTGAPGDPLPASQVQNKCRSFVENGGNPLVGDNVYENYDHDVIVNYFPQGSNVGRGQLCYQKAARDPRVPYIDFARSSSAPASGFQCTVANGGTAGTTLRFIAFARDAISWTHWNTPTGGGGAVTNLTSAQLKGIFDDCTITDWGQVGGVAGKPIVVFTAIPGSGTRSAFESFIGAAAGSSADCIPAQFKDGSVANGERVNREHQMEPIEQALNDLGAADEGNSISFMSVGLYRSNPGLAATSLIGNVNGVEPTGPNIIDGTFPYSRNMYNVIRQAGAPAASGAVRRFTGMSANPDGQTIGWICKGDQWHSEQVGNPNPVGIEDATATQDWAEIKKEAFADSGFYQLPDGAFGNRCTFQDVPVS